MRGLFFRLAGVMIGLAPFAVAEATFAILDWGRPDYSEDPFLGFSAVYPLFVPSEDGTGYETAPSRLCFFRPESFAANKEEDEFRIFCVGGSTVQGRPFAIETSLTTWLELSLQAADPKRTWEVVNCGGVSYASYRLVPILEELLGYEADLIILYTGHNEFLEDRTYGHIKHVPGVVSRPCQFVARTRTYTLLRRGYDHLTGRPAQAAAEGRPILGPETDAVLEYQGGLDQYHRDEKWRRDVIEHFRYNLHRMVQMARDADVPLLLVNPVCNLRDCSPFKAQHRDGLAEDELRQWKSLIGEAGKCRKGNVRRAVTLLKQAMAIDDQHAGLHYLLAKCYDALGMKHEAYKCYVQAKELDICPLRMLEPMNQAVLEIARQTDTPVVDLRRTFETLSEAGIPGSYLMLDHVHPSVVGHQLIAHALADELIRQRVVNPTPGWKEERDRKYREHLQSLDDLYFAKGQERLEALRLWTQGKGSRVRANNDTRPKT